MDGPCSEGFNRYRYKIVSPHRLQSDQHAPLTRSPLSLSPFVVILERGGVMILNFKIIGSIKNENENENMNNPEKICLPRRNVDCIGSHQR